MADESLRTQPSAAAVDDAQAARAALERIIACPAFPASERRRALLRYIVEAALADRHHQLKAYAIAVDVLGRNDRFDPQTDPIVRIEAGRLRRDLDQYYLTAGRGDPLRISIPKGHYVPSFERCRSLASSPAIEPAADGAGMVAPPASAALPDPVLLAAPAGSARTGRLVAAVLALALLAGLGSSTGIWLVTRDEGETPALAAQRAGPAVIVLPFEALSGDEGGRLLAGGFTGELITQLMRFDGLEVFAGPAPGPGGIPAPRAANEAMVFVVAGSVQRGSEQLRIMARLTERDSGKVLWSQGFDRALTTSDIFEVESELAAGIVARLAQPYGIINAAAAERPGRERPATLFAYDCVQRAFAYRRTA